MNWLYELFGIYKKPVILSKEKLNDIIFEEYGIECIFFFNGKKYITESCEFLQILTTNEIIFMNGEKLYVNVNDVFAWGCGDAELLLSDDLEYLVTLHLSNLMWGVAKWACIKRNMQPQYPIKRDMKRNGYWDCELEALPVNMYD